MKPFVPSFNCEYCGESKDAQVSGDFGVFVPCDCKESRERRDQDHYIEMERRKQRRRGSVR